MQQLSQGTELKFQDIDSVLHPHIATLPNRVLRHELVQGSCITGRIRNDAFTGVIACDHNAAVLAPPDRSPR